MGQVNPSAAFALLLGSSSLKFPCVVHSKTEKHPGKVNMRLQPNGFTVSWARRGAPYLPVRCCYFSELKWTGGHRQPCPVVRGNSKGKCLTMDREWVSCRLLKSRRLLTELVLYFLAGGRNALYMMQCMRRW